MRFIHQFIRKSTSFATFNCDLAREFMFVLFSESEFEPLKQLLIAFMKLNKRMQLLGNFRILKTHAANLCDYRSMMGVDVVFSNACIISTTSLSCFYCLSGFYHGAEFDVSLRLLHLLGQSLLL